MHPSAARPGWFIAAVQTLIFLARTGTVCSSGLIAEYVRSHPTFLRRVLAQLVQAGLVLAHEGRVGGYCLACSADQITLAQVYEAIKSRDGSFLLPLDYTRGPVLEEPLRIVLGEVLDELDLKVPHLEGEVSPEKLLLGLGSQWTAYFPFLISFATILIMWVSHHNLFKLISRSDNTFMFANGFLLLMVTIVPFPTAVVADYLTTPAAPAACSLYASIFVIINLAYNILWWSAAYRRRLLIPGISNYTLKRLRTNFLLGFPGYIFAAIVAWWNPFICIAICGLLWVFWAFNKIDHKVPNSQTGNSELTQS